MKTGKLALSASERIMKDHIRQYTAEEVAVELTRRLYPNNPELADELEAELESTMLSRNGWLFGGGFFAGLLIGLIFAFA